MDNAARRAALAWLAEMGADEAIADDPVDRFAARREVPPAALRQVPSPLVPVVPIVAPEANAPPAVAAADALAAAAASLPDLEAAVRRFEGCTLKATATNTVFADGVPGSRVMFVGEAPGADEDRLGKPFVGVSGQLLDRMIRWIGLERARNVYIANVLYWRPPGNRTPTTAEVAACLPFIRRQIELARPDILVFLGASAAHALLGTTGAISRLRGRWLEYRSPGLPHALKGIATFHPAYLLRSPGQKKESWRDLLMIQNELIRSSNKETANI